MWLPYSLGSTYPSYPSPLISLFTLSTHPYHVLILNFPFLIAFFLTPTLVITIYPPIRPCQPHKMAEVYDISLNTYVDITGISISSNSIITHFCPLLKFTFVLDPSSLDHTSFVRSLLCLQRYNIPLSIMLTTHHSIYASLLSGCCNFICCGLSASDVVNVLESVYSSSPNTISPSLLDKFDQQPHLCLVSTKDLSSDLNFNSATLLLNLRHRELYLHLHDKIILPLRYPREKNSSLLDISWTFVPHPSSHNSPSIWSISR